MTIETVLKNLIMKKMAVAGLTMFLFLPRPVFAVIDNPTITLASPDGKVKLTVNTINGMLNYAIKFNNTDVILPSAMSITINDKKLGVNDALAKVNRYTVNETYPIIGIHQLAVNHFNGADIHIASSQNPFLLQARVFNNGVAFRYVIDQKGNSIVNKDSTTFNLNSGITIWSQSNIKYYEGRYERKSIEGFKPGDLVGPPATLQLPGDSGYAAITEAGLIDFAGMSLTANGSNGFTANLTGTVKKIGKIETPWRIVEVGKDLNALVNCDIISNVSPAFNPQFFPNGPLTSWVKPGRSVWSWLADERAVTLSNMKHFTDLAAALGFEYNLVDEGWGNWKNGSHDQWDMMKELVDYSAKQNVKIWVWKAYPDRKGIEGINTPGKRDAFFKRCKDLGIAGLKVDFFDSESQEIVDFYQNALKDAARYQLMMDFHGANKPTGENRTWPNELSREAIRGLENSPPWAKGNTTLPFTRFLAGPADFTPVNFTKLLGEVSWAHQVATMAVFTSPLMCLGADPKSILDNPCKKMMQSIPPVWDETIVLPQSKIGELALFARRKGNNWYLAGLNGEADPKNLTIDLSFLKKGNYTIEEIADDPKTQSNVLLNTRQLRSSKPLNIVMNGFCGYIARIGEK